VAAIFVGPNGVRAGWRFLAYAAILIGLNQLLQNYAVPPAFVALKVPRGGVSAQALIIVEIAEGLSVLVATAICAAFERRRIDSYGLPLRLAFRARFWEGATIGVVSAGGVGIAMLAVGAMAVNGLCDKRGRANHPNHSLAAWYAARRPE
jgi:hypothetical protein